MLVFDREGRYLQSWGNGAFLCAHGLSIVDDRVYLTDRDSSVCLVYTLDGKPIQMLGRHGVHSDTGCEHPGDLVPRAAGPFNYPSELVAAPSGDLYVSDGYRNARVHRFAWDGTWKASWGEPGKTAPGQFHLPHSLLVAHGNVYVCDRENHRIQVFTLDGAFLGLWTDIQRPMDIAAGRDGMLYISEGSVDGSSARLSILDRDGSVQARFPCRGSGHGCWVDAHGDVYVALGEVGGVDKFVRRG
jgi:hypothetical protein